MATPSQQATIFNEAIAQGLSQDEAIDLAGITDFNLFVIDEFGLLTPRAQVQSLAPEPVSDFTYGESGGFVFGPDGELLPADSPEAEVILAEEVRVQNRSAAPVGGNFVAVFDPETGRWNVEDLDTGEILESGLTQQQAIIAAQDASTGGTGYPPGTGADTADPGFVPQQTVSQQQAAQQQATLARARAQATLQAQRKQANDGDWRVRLRLAPLATYLYKSQQPGILQPLAVTDGVIFPYTPQITTAYRANYSTYDLTHSNYRGYFYQNSYVDEITINATFTAQDTSEANYLLAVITFFKSVTKMFYGQDAERGAPPPMVYLQGFGQFQYNLHPCVVSSFNYVLPTDVDYIRARSTNINGTNLLLRRDRQDLPTNPFSSALSRIINVLGAQGIKKGAVPNPPGPPTLGTNAPTYVPTRIEITLTLLPMQSREQVSKQFSVKQFANGDLIKGGFW